MELFSQIKPVCQIPSQLELLSEKQLMVKDEFLIRNTQLTQDLTLHHIQQSRHFVPSIILANVMSLSPKIDEIRLYFQDHVPDIMFY